jgi:regulator of protease activity HflC (stomatin/prohibitin superfamily)
MSSTVGSEDLDTPTMPPPHVRERAAFGSAGIPVLLLVLVLFFGGLALIIAGSAGRSAVAILTGSLVIVVAAVVRAGLIMVAPGEARVVQFFGRYIGTVRQNGLRWVNPFTARRRVSTRIRNHETAVLKVNDADGNPVEIGTVVVWQVADTARAVFEVDDFVRFVAIQAETAVRHIATSYPYDAHGDERLSLRENASEITERLSAEIAARVEAAGVRVVESRITHLAYAPEVAAAMLRRQQANAVVAARQRIVEGAVGMVELALSRLTETGVVDLDEERKASMVSNLMVVLCGDQPPSPIVNAGSLYS